MAEVISSKKLKLTRKTVPPRESGVRTAKDWAARKRSTPKEYGVTPDGDLTTPDGQVIPIQPYVAAPPELIEERYKARRAEIATAEDVFNVARRECNAVLSEYLLGKATAADVVIANQKVHDADCVISQRATGPQFIETPDGLMGRELNFNVYDTAKLVEPVVQGCYTTFAWQMLMEEKRAREAVEAPVGEELLEEQASASASAAKKSAQIGAIIAANRARKAAGM